MTVRGRSHIELTPPLIAIALLLLSPWSLRTAVAAQGPDGSQLFEARCTSCHNGAAGPDASRAPDREALAAKSPEAIIAALGSGVMAEHGADLSPEERQAIAEVLTGRSVEEPDRSTPIAGRCTGVAAGMADPESGQRWNGWGVEPGNSRFQPAPMSGLSAQEVPRLKVKWAFGFPEASRAYGHPTVAADRVFVGSADGQVYSLDAASGCVYWLFETDAGVRAAITIGRRLNSSHGYVAYFGDTGGNVYAVDAESGRLIWRARPDGHPQARITGSPVLSGGRLYVPVSSGEEAAATDPSYPCCTFRGSVVALDAANGDWVWKTHAISEPPQQTGRSPAGSQLWGPSGAAIWSAPTLDLERGRLYVATGNDYSNPPSTGSDAVVALSMVTGQVLWTKQLTENDAWNVACLEEDTSNCPENAGPDVDFGSSPILHTLPDGGRVLLATQKSGIVHALDPDRAGAIKWQTRVGRGGVLGGVEWGAAADDEAIYVAVSDYPFNEGDSSGGGMWALSLATGGQVWHTPAPPPVCPGAEECYAAQLAAVTLIPGVAFSGSFDGHLRAYSTADGSIVWDFDTVGDYTTVNEVPAKGGSINGPGPTIVGGVMYVNSGYGSFGGMPGNVLLALTVDGR